ncbi:MAG: hypothetical protein AAFX87_10940 [Bacteroidota bacterium]
MKKFLPLLALVLIASACDVYIIEPAFDDRNKFVGTYRVEEYSTTLDQYAYFDIRISKSNNGYHVFLRNFYGVDIRVRADVEANRLIIPHQIVNGYEVQGSGTWYDGELTLTYSVRDLESYPVFTDFCSAKAWR